MNHEEEISLREIIETVWKGKWIIGAITVVAVLLAGIYSFVIANETYKGEATVNVTQITTVPGDVQPYITNMTKPEVFKQTLLSSTVLKQVIEKEGMEKTIGALQSGLQVDLPSEENGAFITISMEGPDRERIKSVIDTAIAITKEEMGENIDSRLALLTNEYENKMKEEDENLGQAVQEFNDMRAGEGLPALILFEETGGSSRFILDGNEDLINELRDLDKMDQIEYQKINNKIANLASLFTFYNNKYDEVVSIRTMNIMDISLDVMADTFVPINPIAPNKLLNVAIALVLGLMIGVGYVFLHAYMREDYSNEPVKKEKNAE